MRVGEKCLPLRTPPLEASWQMGDGLYLWRGWAGGHRHFCVRQRHASDQGVMRRPCVCRRSSTQKPTICPEPLIPRQDISCAPPILRVWICPFVNGMTAPSRELIFLMTVKQIFAESHCSWVMKVENAGLPRMACKASIVLAMNTYSVIWLG